MGILLCEQNFRDVWRRNKSGGQKLVKFCAHTHAAKLVVELTKFFIILQLLWRHQAISFTLNSLHTERRIKRVYDYLHCSPSSFYSIYGLPILDFNTATDRILNNTTQALTLGVNYDDSGQSITGLDNADDVVIFADLFNTLKDALLIFSEQSPKQGLYINWTKTRLHSFSPWIPTPPTTLIGTQTVRMTDYFT